MSRKVMIFTIFTILIGGMSISKTEAIMASSSITSNQTQFKKNGLMGYYFRNNDFKDLILFSPSNGEALSYDKNQGKTLFPKIDNKYKSILWKGNYVSSSTGEFHFNATKEFNTKTTIFINNEIVSDKGNNLKTVSLTKSKKVAIRILFNSDTPTTEDDLHSFNIYIQNDKEKIKISNDQLLLSFDEEKKNLISRDYSSDDSIDTDGDNIPDVCEQNGYTISNMIAIPWTDDLSASGHTKYLSNKYNAHTAGDPYNDYEKASETIDKATDSAAFNPLVAATPVITVALEKVILSPNQNLSNSVASTQSTNWSSSNTIGISTTETASILPSLSVTENFSNTTTTGYDWGSTQGNTNEFNSASAAYLNANVRYYNTGTGAIYSVKPTTNFVLGNNTIATIDAQDNTTALTLGANETYPNLSQHGIAINTMDNFNSHPISLNSTQFNSLLNNELPLSIETTQTEGNYMKYDDNGNLVVGGSWDGYQEQIKNMTTNFIIDTGVGATERNVAARNFDNPDDFTPIMSVKEGLELAYPDSFTEKKGDPEGATPVTYFNNQPFNEEAYIAIVDNNTNNMIEKQKSNAGKFGNINSIFDLKLMEKMNMSFKLPMYYNIASDNNVYSDGQANYSIGNWVYSNVKKDSKSVGGYTFYNTTTTNFPVVVFPKSVTDKLYNSDKSYYGTYIISLYMKADQESKTNSAKVTVNINNFRSNQSMAEKTVNLTNEYQRVDLMVYNGSNDDYISSIHINNQGNFINWNSISINKISGLDLTKQN